MFGALLEVAMSKKCTPLWREADFEVKMYKARQVRTTFGSWDVEKVHAAVARSRFRSQNVQSTPGSDHFWKLRCLKRARGCGAKHISKSKRTKHTMFGPLLEVEMSKKCTPLWREADFEVKMYKAHQVRTTFGSWDVEKVHAVVVRSTFPSQNVKNTRGSDHDVQISDVVSRGRRKGLCAPCQKWAKRDGFVSFSTRTTTTPHYTPIHYTTTTITPSLHSTTLHSITFNYTTVHYTTLHSTTLHYTTLHDTTLHSTTTTLHYIPLHSTTLHSTTLNWMTLHYTYN